MRIEPMMSLSDLNEHMGQDVLPDATLIAMRRKLVSVFDGEDTGDVPESLWEIWAVAAGQAKNDIEALYDKAAAEFDSGLMGLCNRALTGEHFAIEMCLERLDP